MPELQIDVVVANRFISSLSKSLQALCHGCMEFDSGIEIVGYININIDSGSKVDYVLNEKVLKSTTNSMTFVSNSFLAKKEQQKQTRDGACSPIPQPQSTPSYASQMRGAHYGSPYERTASQLSSHAQLLRGSQKRTRPDNWRSSSKKYHMNESPDSSFTGQAIQHSQMTPLSSTSSFTDSNFKQPQVPTNSDVNVGDATLQLQINIKKEALEADTQNDTDTEHLGNPSDDQKLNSSHDEIDKLQVKRDPDDTVSYNSKTVHPDSNGAVASEDTDLKDNFLEPCSSEHPQKSAEESSYQSESDNHLPTFGQESESAITKDQTLTDEINVPSTSALNLADSDAGISVENESDIPIEYDEAAEDESGPQSAYDDAGEGSSDAGQFEVIEIDDEDEDVQAMFGDHHRNSLIPRVNVREDGSSFSHSSGESKVGNLRRNLGSVFHYMQTDLLDSHCCSHCQEVLPDGFALRRHLQENHNINLRHICPECGKAYLGRSGLFYHMQASHQMKSFLCPVCSARFTRKSSIKSHLMGVHKMGQCVKCTALVKYRDYQEHVQQCCAV